MKLRVLSNEDEKKNFSTLVIKKQISKTMPEELLNDLSILCIENNITKLLSYEETIKGYAAKTCRNESIIELCKAVS